MNNEETQTDRMLQFLTWVEVNKQRLLYGAVGALVLGLAVYVFNYTRQQRELDANAALFALDKLPEGREKAPPTPAADYLKVADQYSGTRAAERALLLGAGSLFSEKNYDEARAKFEQFLRDHTASPSASTAAYGIAACLDAKNDVDKAMEAYQRVIGGYATAPEATQAKLALAILHETKGQPDAALKIYDDILRPRQPSVWNSEATMRRELLLAKHPALATPVVLPTFKPTAINAPPATNAAPQTNSTVVTPPAPPAKQ